MLQAQKKDIGKRIKLIYKTKGLNQQEFGKRLSKDYDERIKGVGEPNYASTISGVVTGKKLPPTKILTELIQFFPEGAKQEEGKPALPTSLMEVLFGEEFPSVKQLALMKGEWEKDVWERFVSVCKIASDLCPKDFCTPKNEYETDHYGDNYYADFPDEEDDEKDGGKCVHCCSERLKDIRIASGISIYDMAKQLGTDSRAIYRIEENRNLPKCEVLVRYCEITQASPDYIIWGNYPGLPKELRGILGFYGYASQQRLLTSFCRIAEKFEDFLEN